MYFKKYIIIEIDLPFHYLIIYYSKILLHITFTDFTKICWGLIPVGSQALFSQSLSYSSSLAWAFSPVFLLPSRLIILLLFTIYFTAGRCLVKTAQYNHCLQIWKIQHLKHRFVSLSLFFFFFLNTVLMKYTNQYSECLFFRQCLTASTVYYKDNLDLFHFLQQCKSFSCIKDTKILAVWQRLEHTADCMDYIRRKTSRRPKPDVNRSPFTQNKAWYWNL